MSERRIVLVRNPNSTRAKRVEKDIVAPLNQTDNVYQEFVTQHPDTEANIEDMREFFREGDLILSAGGDGTTMQVANAVLREHHADTLIAPLAVGNFNDIAGAQRNPIALLSPDAHVETIHPLTVDVNGEYWRDSPAYVTLGATAVLAGSFGNTDSREAMRQAPEWAKLAYSIGQLGVNYFKVRGDTLSPFHTSQANTVRHAVTDVLLINNRRVGRIIRSDTDYSAGPVFGYREANVSHILPNLPFGLRALAGKTPADVVSEIRIMFEHASSVPIQSEGEFTQLHGVHEIFVYKDPAKTLRLVRATV
ncbi:MAG: hypothetical protein KA604_01675 [Candidatus Saccharimonas sp.]|nr:hypothetical protein [Candidatus Saccharimonas sp.]